MCNETVYDLSGQELISPAVRLFSAFAKILSSPEKTAEFVDTIIEKDEKTGESLLRIAVPDKETVVSVQNVIGKLLSHR